MARVVVFYAVREGLGRTVTTAQLALLLAGGGMRVAVVDPGRDPSDLRRCLRRRLPPEGGDESVPLRLRSPAGHWIDFYGPAAPPPAPGAGYDYVLVDVPSRDEETLRRTAVGADQVVLCFRPSMEGIAEAAEQAALVGALAGRETRIRPLAMQVALEEPGALARAREAVRAAFRPYSGDDVLWSDMEIPFWPAYTYYDGTAPLEESPTLAAAYEALARALTDGKLTALSRVVVRYEPDGRVWAEWLAEWLNTCGLAAPLYPMAAAGDVRPTRDTAVADVRGARAEDDDDPALRWSRGGPYRRAPRTREARLRVHRWNAETEELELGARTEATLDVDLARRFGTRLPEYEVRFRFPGHPPVHNLPPPLRSFVGRERSLMELRDRFGTGTGRRVVVLDGEAGRGKSELAAEYARRFGGAYDVVWWVPAHGAEAARRSLRDLADRLGLRTGGDAARAALGHLSGGREGWLLVYDNADDPAALDGLLPGAGGGHVLVTTRSAPWPQEHERCEVAEFTEDEAVELLLRHMDPLGALPPAMRPALASAAALVGRLPFAVELAGSWLRAEHGRRRAVNDAAAEAASAAVAAFESRFREELVRLSRLRPHPELSPAGRAVVAMALAAAEEDARDDPAAGDPGGNLTRWYLEACALLSEEGVGVRLLRAPQTRAAAREGVRADAAAGVDPAHAPAGGGLAHPLVVDAVLTRLTRHALVRADFERESVRMHRFTRELVRARLPDMAARKEALAEALAAYAPDTLPGNERVYAELRPHVVPLDAHLSPHPAVHAWLVNHVRFLWLRDDRESWEAGEALARRAIEQWTAARGGGLPDVHVPGMRTQLANIYRSLGRNREAAAQSEPAVVEQRLLDGSRAPVSLTVAAGYAADLRLQGRYAASYAEDHAIWSNLSRLLGDRHPLTSGTLTNLMASAALCGDAEEALSLAERQFARLRAMYGDDHPDLWMCACRIARYQRDLGRYRAAQARLTEALEHLGQSPGPAEIRLRAQTGLAIVARHTRDTASALRRDTDTYEEYLKIYGDAHVGTLACAMSLAADLHAAGKRADAVERAEATHARLIARGYGMPYVMACQVNLAVYARAAGELDRARQLGEEAVRLLRAALSPWHPLTLAAMANHAGTLVRLGHLESAAELEREAADGFAARLPADHPSVRTVLANLADTEARRRGERPSAPREDIDVELPGH
ncbi:hypothetical protein HNP84_008904 [Thermocatellispora tengchongensis]|uniref:Tetratricopeptide repeat protein n=1 Tax=Thermocatellispora tengchongensis TaxID=1073253 RepID=A0A840PMX8_9ACTN|nr:FxSxx-COOH system tetratricopeptide repeat protein [Thermocatellispora tengchongensis]MBB5139141.1 hypothetical protein [Thermocatellispora tengchongensis]